MATKQIRHGDVLLTRVGDAAEPQIRPPSRRAVLAHGEATGHAHVATGDGLAFRPSVRELALPFGGALTHEEHGLVVLEPGLYDVRRQIEFVEQRAAQVRD